MGHLELVAVVVEEYDPAIDFFVDVLGFELVEDIPHSPTMAGPSAGWSFARWALRPAFSWRARTATGKRPLSDSSLQVE